MTSRHADVFFYGLFMDGELLRSKGLSPERVELASVEPPSPAERNPAYAARLRVVAEKIGLPAEYVASLH